MLSDVWICSGQSNMEMPVGNTGPGYWGVTDFESELAAADFPDLRLFRRHLTFLPVEFPVPVARTVVNRPTSKCITDFSNHRATVRP